MQDFEDLIFNEKQSIPFLRKLDAKKRTKIRARDWILTSDYHDLRQKFLNRILCNPGILWGFEIKFKSKSDKNIIVTIYPGVAIDSQGRIIVLKESRDYIIDTEDKQVSFICVAYANNLIDDENNDDNPYLNFQQKYKEDTCSLREYTEENYVNQEINFANNIEIFRILLLTNYAINTNTQTYSDYLSPQINEIDLRFRKNSHPFLEGSINIGILIIGEKINPEIRLDLFNWEYLKQACEVIYSKLKIVNIQLITEEDLLPEDCDFFYLRYQDSQKDEIVKTIKKMLEKMRENKQVLVIDSVTDNNNLSQELNIELSNLTQGHFCCQSPFLFDSRSLPVEKLSLAESEGVIAIQGNLSATWGLGRSRELIRSGHEFGVNILYYSWKRRYFFQIFNPVGNKTAI